ncbi:WSC-domain-containing protein, partial [Auricularia subglabra TFB-10046 SS5]
MLRSLAAPLLVASAVRASAGLVSGWRVLNECAIDTDDRVLKDFTVTRGDDTTPASCIATCSVQGYTHAGVEDGMECYCGNGVEDDVESAQISECDVPCSGDASQKCGGDWRIALYTSGSSDRPPTPLPSGWGMVADCAVDVAERLFADAQLTELRNNTPLACATHCSDQGLAFASVENGRECYCGSNLARLVTPRPVSDCYMQCPGDAEQECGGPWAAQIYSVRPGLADSSLVQAAPSAPPSATPAFLAPVDPADLALGLPAGWRTAYACAQNGDPQLLEDSNMLRDNSPARCSELCEAKGYRVAGVEYSGVCSCGDEYEELPVLRPVSECSIPCPRDPNQMCGGEWRVQLYTR